ncbi:MAG: cobyric acid synthase [Actinomycetota bacterium]|nr:cobyric acid synthase [Actinomycetota bacterium]
MRGALLVAGTTSDAGKSVLTAGICRWLSRHGVRVAPFKAQNMSNNSWVTADGGEIGRAQAMQAAAARAEPEAAMNPVLLKPGSDRSSAVLLLGRPYAEVTAASYRELKPALLGAALDALADLRNRYDVVVCEGAGSPAEINLRDTDIANMGLARAAGLPVVVVGDIDRGGWFAQAYGTLALLDAADQALVAGFVVNKFRGDRSLLEPGLTALARLTGRPTLGVVPWAGDRWVDVEDSLGIRDPRPAGPPVGEDVLRVAVVRLPRISNFTDVDALATEPGVAVRFVTSPGELADVDLVVLPGSRATVSDLGWLRERGLAEAIRERARRDLPVLGICGGYQMLAEEIVDEVESRAGTVPGLGVLPARVAFAESKVLARPRGAAYGEPVAAYEIHHGRVTVHGPAAPFLDGCRRGAVWGTTWHGAFENDGFRRAWLRDVAQAARRRFVPAPDTDFAAVRERRLDLLGDLVEEHLDTGALTRLIEQGAPGGLPFVPPGAPARG